jgi:hypothetical protein
MERLFRTTKDRHWVSPGRLRGYSKHDDRSDQCMVRIEHRRRPRSLDLENQSSSHSEQVFIR